jgi:hypothetical protein
MICNEFTHVHTIICFAKENKKSSILANVREHVFYQEKENYNDVNYNRTIIAQNYKTTSKWHMTKYIKDKRQERATT